MNHSYECDCNKLINRIFEEFTFNIYKEKIILKKLCKLNGRGNIIKKIRFEISLPIKRLQQGKTYNIRIKEDATFLECLAMVDKVEAMNTQTTIFPIYEGYIHNYMQMFINFETNSIYEDVGIYAYAPNEDGLMKKFNPVRENIEFNVYPDSYIQLQPDVGC